MQVGFSLSSLELFPFFSKFAVRTITATSTKRARRSRSKIITAQTEWLRGL